MPLSSAIRKRLLIWLLFRSFDETFTMKQLTVLFALITLLSCSGHSHRATHALKTDSTFLMFMLDPKIHSVAVAWSMIVSIDTQRIVDGGQQPYIDTVAYINWPITVMDSAKKVNLKNEEGKDSTTLGWLVLDRNSIIRDLGRGNTDKLYIKK